MKKKIIFLILLVLITGCTSKSKRNTEDNILNSIDFNSIDANYICNYDKEYDDYLVGGKYAITLDENKFVKNIYSVEVIDADKEETLNYFESYYISNYEKIAQYGGYTYNIDKDDKKIIITTNILYDEFNLQSYVTDFPENIELVNDDFKITEQTILDIYHNLGYTCSKK